MGAPRAPELGDWFGLLGLTAFWGSAFLFNELALQSFPPIVLVASRVVLAAGILYVYMRASGVRLPRTPRAWLAIAMLAVLGNVLPFNLVAWGQQHIDSAVTGVVMGSMPLFVLALAHFLVPGSRMTGHRIVGFLCGFAGVAVIMGPQALAGIGGNMELWGILAVLGAALSYAVNSIFARRIGLQNPLALATGMILAASAITLPGALLQIDRIALPPSGTALLAVALLGLFSTGFATVLFFKLVQGPGPTFLSLVNYLVPAWAVLAGALILGERLETYVYAGLVLILAGIAISEIGPRLRLRRRLRDTRKTLLRRLDVATEEA